MPAIGNPPTARRLRWELRATVVALLTATSIGAWPAVVNWRQSSLAEELAVRALAAPDESSRQFVRRLTELDLAAIKPLTRLAASQRDVVSAAARQAVSHRLTNWQIAAECGAGTAEFAEQLAALSSALEDRFDEFGDEGRRWAMRLSRRIADCCDGVSAQEAWPILTRCDRMLGELANWPSKRYLTAVALAAEPTGSLPSPPGNDAALPAAANDAVPSAAGDDRPSDVARPLADLALVEPPAPSNDPPSVGSPGPPANPLRSSSAPPPVRSQEEANQLGEPAVPIAERVVDVPSPKELRQLVRRLRDLSDRELITRLDASARFESSAVRQVLRERGYSDGLLDVTRQLERLPAGERRASLERASLLPPADARRLLRWFISDADSEVRLAALALFATTGDPQLEEIARKRAIEDDDPRVVALAEKLMRR